MIFNGNGYSEAWESRPSAAACRTQVHPDATDRAEGERRLPVMEEFGVLTKTETAEPLRGRDWSTYSKILNIEPARSLKA